MTLQWYPGHMTKARREIVALMPSQDVVIEVLDARLPSSSSNPAVTELRRDKPNVKVLTKSDLADPDVTAGWIAYFQTLPNVRAFASTTDNPTETRKKIAELIVTTLRDSVSKIQVAAGDGTSPQPPRGPTADAIAALLRRTALAIAPRTVIAGMTGPPWLDWLARQSPEPLPDAVRDQLVAGVYGRPTADRDLAAFRNYADRWIRTHRRPPAADQVPPC